MPHPLAKRPRPTMPSGARLMWALCFVTTSQLLSYGCGSPTVGANARPHPVEEEAGAPRCLRPLRFFQPSYRVVTQEQDLTRVLEEQPEVPAEALRCAPLSAGCEGADYLVVPGTFVFLSSSCSSVDEVNAAWRLSLAPSGSPSKLVSIVQNPVLGDGVLLELDVSGAYRVEHTARDAADTIRSEVVDLRAGVPEGLSVEVTWRDAPAKDLDLHLLLDDGPDVTSPAIPFCRQDCFFWNPLPDNLSPGVDDDPRFLRDDMGDQGGAEVIALPRMTPGTRWRVGVHGIGLGDDGRASPMVRVLLRDAILAELTPRLSIAQNEFWLAARLDVKDDGTTVEVAAVDTILRPSSEQAAPAGHYWQWSPAGGACTP